MIDKKRLIDLIVIYRSMLSEERKKAVSYIERDFLDDHRYFADRVFDWLYDFLDKEEK